MSTHTGYVRVSTPDSARLLQGLSGTTGRLNLADHLAVHGPMAGEGTRARLHHDLAIAGLRGRGGAGFPLASKVQSLASRRRPIVVVNASEGEPLSRKDAVLVGRAPHLVLDGAQAVAESLRASEVIVYLHEGRLEASASLEQAVAERTSDQVPTRVVAGPARYVAGEASAAANFLSGGDALPTRKPPHTTEKGVRGRPTLLSNAETFAHVALIARHGADWFRSIGSPDDPGTVLLTVSDGTTHVVVEVPTATPLATVVDAAGGSLDRVSALLLGGYAGTWALPEQARSVVLDRDVMTRDSLTLGVGQVGLLPTDGCFLRETARITEWLAGQTAGQCGPCVHGLPDIAGAVQALADGTSAGTTESEALRWAGLVAGRGACGHPGGVARLVRSALALSPEHLLAHRQGTCQSRGGAFPIPRSTVGAH